MLGRGKLASLLFAGALIAFATVAPSSLAAASTAASPIDSTSADSAAAKSPALARNLIDVGKVGLAAPIGRKAALLVPVSYPLEVSGRLVRSRFVIRLPGGKKSVRTWTDRPHRGALRAGDRRKSFRFVHAVPVNSILSRVLRKKGRKVKVSSTFSVRLLPESLPQSQSLYRGSRSQSSLRRAAPSRCSSAPMLLVAGAGGTVREDLPRCGARLRWTVDRKPDRGTAKNGIRRFAFSTGKSPLGADQFRLRGLGSGNGPVRRTVQVRTSRSEADSISVTALGDSVTAGFGYFGETGRPMPIADLLQCRPGATVYNDACSSNSANRNSSVGSTPNYLPDYGLSRNIAWPAQWANQYGITDYRNYAVTGSAPSDWLPGGQFHQTLLEVQRQNPDYIVMTMGANPLLSDMLFGIDNMGCAIEADLFGDYKKCIEEAFDSVNLDKRLNAFYTSLVANTTSNIVLMQYHLSIPSSALAYSSTQIEMMITLLNDAIAEQASQVSTERIAVVSPPRFFVGIDMEPLYPSRFSCSWAGFKVDGPSVQSDPTQDELSVLDPLSFCQGPAVGPPWIISGDTGIHPSVAGHAQMAGRMPAPR